MRLLLKRWWWALLLALTVVGLCRVRFDVEVLNLLPDDLPVVHGLRLYQKHFASMRELVVTVRSPDAGKSESAARQIAEGLRRETNLVAGVVWEPPWVEHPEQMVELIAHLWLNQPPETFAQLANRLAPAGLNSLLQETREQLATSLSPMEIGRLSYDPFGFTRLPEAGPGEGALFNAPHEGFASADGCFRAVFVEARGTLENYRTCAGWFADIRAAVGRCESSADWPAGVRVRYTGAPPFTTEIGTGMERGIQGSVLATLVLIVLLFWWAHRSWRPLALLLVMLVFVVAGALAAGGLIFSRLNAVSLGFAAILLGLAVDYGLVIYHEWMAAPRLPARALQGLVAPSIIWSAVTTAAAFGLLNFAGLPGLSQLGSLVSIGILLAAVLMLYGFLPLVLRWGRLPATRPRAAAAAARRQKGGTLLCWRVLSLVSAGAALGILWRAWPQVEHSSSPLEPKHSAARLALDEMQAELTHKGEPLLLVVSGRDESQVAQRLDAAQVHLARVATNHALRSFRLPTALWPHADRQQSNLVTARALAGQAEVMKSAATQAGFTSNALALTETLMRTWEQAAGATEVLRPTNETCRWLLKRATAWTGTNWLAVGALYPGTNASSPSRLAALDPGLPGVWLTGWTQLGESLLQSVEHRLWGVMLGMIAVVGMCLWLTFRRWREVLLSFAAPGFSVLVLLAVMGVAGQSWNLMNLMALPLLLGAGVDYTIHVQLALRRHGGDVAAMRRITGRAVFLCAATTVAGFGSNAFASNAGLSSLGLVCASGIAIVYLTAVFLVPAWWVWVEAKTEVQSAKPEDRNQNPESRTTSPPLNLPSAPSSFYKVGLWRLGLAVVRTAPAWLVRFFCVAAAELYFRVQGSRREVVIQNLLPAVSGDRLLAERTARRLYRNFGLKLVDLWGVESGVPVRNWVLRAEDDVVIRSAYRRGQGVLFIALHLGNWEHGGLLLADMGIKLTVMTGPEPEEGLTELRIASRARWGIDTLVVGRDWFAFVEVIKRLQDGTAFAVSIDRAPERGSVMVELFGRPFRASNAVAELARASGCALIGVTIVRRREGYAVKVVPEFRYDRRALGSHEARRELTQQIMRAFEPEIQEHLDQWYHFVPIWPAGAQGGGSTRGR